MIAYVESNFILELALRQEEYYASILAHLRAEDPTESKVFLNRNTRDFLTPDIAADLEPFSCRVVPSFRDGLAGIRASLA